MSEPNVPDFWESKDDASAVNVADLRTVYAFMQGNTARPLDGRSVAVDFRTYENMCRPGADVKAVWYRASMLGILQMIPESPLAPWARAGKLDDAVIRLASTFPMKTMEAGVVHEGLPFDLQEFVKQIGEATEHQE